MFDKLAEWHNIYFRITGNTCSNDQLIITRQWGDKQLKTKKLELEY